MDLTIFRAEWGTVTNANPSYCFLLEPQVRFGDKPLKFQVFRFGDKRLKFEVVYPQNGTPVLKGLRPTYSDSTTQKMTTG